MAQDEKTKEALGTALAAAIEAIHEAFKAATPEQQFNVGGVLKAAVDLAQASMALEVD